MTTRPTATALLAVLDAEAVWLRDQLAHVEVNRSAIVTGSLREMRHAAEHARDYSVVHRRRPGPLGNEAAARHPLVVKEIEGIITALCEKRRGGKATP